MKDQAFALRELVETALPEASPAAVSLPIVVVAGGRPGVGATTVAVNLAAVLADRGERVVLVDTASHEPNAAQVAGAARVVEHSLADVLTSECSAADALVPGPCGCLLLAGSRSGTARRNGELRGGFRRDSPARSIEFSRRAHERLFGELQSLKSLASVVIVDAGSGLTPWTRRFWFRSTLLLLVTTTEDAALLDAYALVKRCAADGIKTAIHVLANQCQSDAKARAVCGRFSSACQRFLSRSVPALPALPRHVVEPSSARRVYPRVWESPNTPFGHAALWLGRAVSELLAAAEVTQPSGATTDLAEGGSVRCAAGAEVF